MAQACLHREPQFRYLCSPPDERTLYVENNPGLPLNAGIATGASIGKHQSAKELQGNSQLGRGELEAVTAFVLYVI